MRKQAIQARPAEPGAFELVVRRYQAVIDRCRKISFAEVGAIKDGATQVAPLKATAFKVCAGKINFQQKAISKGGLFELPLLKSR